MVGRVGQRLGRARRVSLRSCAVAVTAGLCVWIGTGAILSGFGVANLAYPLAMLRLRLPVVFPAHMITGGLGLMLAVLAYAVRADARVHRPLGRLAALLLVAASLTALPTSLESLASPWARAGFFVQGVACLACLVAGFQAIRRGHVERHRRLMLSAAAIAFGAVVLRGLLLAADGLGLAAEPSYAVGAWLAWLMPLAAVNGWLGVRQSRSRA